MNIKRRESALVTIGHHNISQNIPGSNNKTLRKFQQLRGSKGNHQFFFLVREKAKYKGMLVYILPQWGEKTHKQKIQLFYFSLFVQDFMMN